MNARRGVAPSRSGSLRAGLRRRVFFVALGALVMTGAGCDKSGDTPGESLDRALDKTGDAVKDAGEAIKPR